MDQVINYRVYVARPLIMNYKSTLEHQIVYLGWMNSSWQAFLKQRLCYHLTNWSIITQDLWVLNMVWGYLIDFVSEPHQQSPPNPPYYSEQIHEESRSRQFNSWNILRKQGFCPAYSQSTKGWRAETSNKSPSCRHQALQNGGYSHCEKSPTMGLASQSRLERCVLYHPHTSEGTSVFKSLGKGTTLRVYLLSCHQPHRYSPRCWY